MALDPAMAYDTMFMAHIEQEQEKLQSALESAETVEDVLPVFEGALGYNSRILAYILGKSLGISMELSGIKAMNYHDAKGLLQHDKST